MTEAELDQRLASGGLKLAFDTNALVGFKRLVGVATQAAKLNARLQAAARPPVALAVSALAHAEVLFDLKQNFREQFTLERILDSLKSKGVEVLRFEPRHAATTGALLGRSFPDSSSWRAAKKRRCLGCLGLKRDARVPGSGKTCGATVDWFIGGHAVAEDAVLVSDDGGVEFRGLDRVSLSALERALARALGEAP